LKQSTQEVESEAESLTSLGEVNYFSKWSTRYSSAGKVKHN
jgi:hypothetical protein